MGLDGEWGGCLGELDVWRGLLEVDEVLVIGLTPGLGASGAAVAGVSVKEIRVQVLEAGTGLRSRGAVASPCGPASCWKEKGWRGASSLEGPHQRRNWDDVGQLGRGVGV